MADQPARDGVPSVSGDVAATGSSRADAWPGVRASIAAYAQALDQGRIADVGELFVDDGVSEIVGMARFEGRAAITEGYGAFQSPHPQLHLVVNTVVTDGGQGTASARSDLVVIPRKDAEWRLEMVGRYEDELVLVEQRWLFTSRVLTFR